MVILCPIIHAKSIVVNLKAAFGIVVFMFRNVYAFGASDVV